MHDVVTTDETRRRYLEAGLWDDATLPGRVAHWAAVRPDDRAVIDDRGIERTYAELWRDTNLLAAGLIERGVGEGSVVSVQMPNRYETAVVAVAVLATGAVINPLLPNYRHRELEHVFTTARPAAVVSPSIYRGCDHPRLIDEVAAACGHDPHRFVIDGPEWFADLDDAAPVLEGRDAAAVSELIFTSGTESTPKAIMHTEQTANFSVRVAFDDLGLGADTVVWMPSPVGHSTGFNYGLRFALYHGIPLVLQDRWDPDVAVDLVTAHRCSYTLAATTFLQDLVEACQRRHATLDSLTHLGCGGAPVPPVLVEAAAEAGIGVLRLYGSTEVLVATWNRPDSPHAARLHTDGRALSHVEIEVRDGELFTRGPNTCVGFFDDPERTAATFDPDGWVASGDLVEVDDAGYLTVVGRKKEIIIRGGMNIAPREIEQLIGEFAEVERVAVVGLPDQRLGERMCACVTLREGATLDLEVTVDRLRRSGLAVYKLPEALEIVEVLPTTASGKVQKHELVRRLGTGAEG